MDKIVGILWNKNEGDILRFTITKALEVVDHILLADDNSTDNSFSVMESFKDHPKVAFIKKVTSGDKRQILLDKAKSLFGTKDILIQVIESDITLIQTDIRTAWAKYSNSNVAMSWHLINATDPNRWTDESKGFPDWKTPIDQIMTKGHWMEILSHYTFRPLPGIEFELGDGRPWPRGFSKYYKAKDRISIRSDAPLLAHWGYRGPKHWLHKYSKGPGSVHPSKKNKWKIGTIEEIKANVPFFNGVWTPDYDVFPLNREGWIAWIKTKWNRE